MKSMGKWLLLAFCLGVQGGAAEKVRVLTTFLPGYNIAVNVAGDLATVENLVAGNVGLHDYQLQPSELGKLKGADLVLLNGLGLETFFGWGDAGWWRRITEKTGHLDGWFAPGTDSWRCAACAGGGRS